MGEQVGEAGHTKERLGKSIFDLVKETARRMRGLQIIIFYAFCLKCGWFPYIRLRHCGKDCGEDEGGCSNSEAANDQESLPSAGGFLYEQCVGREIMSFLKHIVAAW